MCQGSRFFTRFCREWLGRPGKDPVDVLRRKEQRDGPTQYAQPQRFRSILRPQALHAAYRPAIDVEPLREAHYRGPADDYTLGQSRQKHVQNSEYGVAQARSRNQMRTGIAGAYRVAANYIFTHRQSHARQSPAFLWRFPGGGYSTGLLLPTPR